MFVVADGKEMSISFSNYSYRTNSEKIQRALERHANYGTMFWREYGETEPTDVLLLCYKDNCNRTYKMWKALERTGIKVRAFSLVRHPFCYDPCVPVISLHEMRSWAEKARVVWLTMGNHQLLELISNQKLIVTHTGSTYRLNSAKLNPMFIRADKHVLLGHDHMALGAKNAVYNCCRIIDTDLLQPVYNTGEVAVGHFPSQPEKKGTAEIIGVLDHFRDIRKMIDVRLVSYTENLERMAGCDIYIEQLFPYHNGVKFGEVGYTAYEAAALGNLVLTNLLDDRYYLDRFGEHCLEIVNTPIELKHRLGELLEMDRSDLRVLQEKSRSWIERVHNYDNMGRELLKDVEEYF